MGDAQFILELRTDTLWSADRLVQGLRVTSPNMPKFGEMWLWLDRETDHLAELKPYRFGMVLMEETETYPPCRCGREVRKLNAASDTPKCVGCGYTEELCRCQPTS